MAAPLLARLALLAAAAPALGELRKAELRETCQMTLRGLSLTGQTDTEVAMLCRARLPPELCSGGLEELGPQPWTEDGIGAACGGMADDLELSIASRPRELQGIAYKDVNAKVEECMETKRELALYSAVANQGRPIYILGIPLDMTAIAKFMQTVNMTMTLNDYYKCQRTHCTPTTTSLQPVYNASLRAGIDWAAVNETNASYPAYPSQKFAEGKVSGPSPRGKAFIAPAWLPVFVGGSAMVAVAAFAANRLPRSMRASSVPDESARRLSVGDREAQD